MSRRNDTNLERYGIIRNKKGQKIYYDKRSKTAYILQDSDLKKFQLLYSRPFLSVALGILLYGFLSVNFYVCIGISILAFIALEFYFRNSILGSLARTKNLDGLDIRDLKDVRMDQPKKTLLIKIIGYWGCSIALTVIAYLSDYPIEQKIGVYALAAYTIYNGCLNLIALLNQGSRQ